MKKYQKMPWYPERYLSDPKITSLSVHAELIVRRLTDSLWLTEHGYLPNDTQTLYQVAGRGFSYDQFRDAINDIHESNLFISTGNTIRSRWHIDDHRKIRSVAEKRSTAGRKGGRPKQKQKPAHAPVPVPNTPDEKGSISGDPGRRSGAVSKNGFFDQIKAMNSDSGLSDAARRRLKRDE